MKVEDKLNKIIDIHRAKEFSNSWENKKELDIVMYAIWLKWELGQYRRVKPNKERTFIISEMENLANYLYDKYMMLCGK